MVKIDDKYFDKTLTHMMDKLYNAVCNNWDGLFYIGGVEGSSKSTIAFQLAWYLDRNFNLNNIAFTGQEFINKCLNAKSGDCIVFDESYSVFNNRSYASSLTKKIVNMLTRIRSKQLFIIIVSPTFFDLNKYLIVHRARCFIRTYDIDFKRGQFAYYMFEKKNELYYKGKRDHNIHAAKPTFKGRFTKWSPVDWNEYEKLKQIAMIEDVKDEKEVKQVVDVDKIKGDGNMELLLWLRSRSLLKFGALTKLSEGFFGCTDSVLSKRLSAKISENKNC